MEWARLARGIVILMLIAIAGFSLFAATFLTAFATADCGIEFVGADTCEDQITLSDVLPMLLIPPTLAAAPATLAGRLLGLRWRSSLAAAWLVAIGELALGSMVWLTRPSNASDNYIFVFYGLTLAYAATIAGAYRFWRWRAR
jgi:hypothetical protein